MKNKIVSRTRRRITNQARRMYSEEPGYHKNNRLNSAIKEKVTKNNRALSKEDQNDQENKKNNINKINLNNVKEKNKEYIEKLSEKLKLKKHEEEENQKKREKVH